MRENFSSTLARGEAISHSLRQEKRIERLKADSKRCSFEGYDACILNTAVCDGKRTATIELLDSKERIEVFYDQLIFL